MTALELLEKTKKRYEKNPSERAGVGDECFYCTEDGRRCAIIEMI